MRDFIFYSSGAVAVATTLMVILSRSPVFAVLYLVMSFLSVAMVLYSLGSSFLAVVAVVIYAGAIMVLFIFIVMMLNLGQPSQEPDLRRPTRKQMVVPGLFALVLVAETIYALAAGRVPSSAVVYAPADLGMALYQTHYLGVELASLILLIGIIGGMHLGRALSETETPEKSSDIPL